MRARASSEFVKSDAPPVITTKRPRGYSDTHDTRAVYKSGLDRVRNNLLGELEGGGGVEKSGLFPQREAPLAV